MSDPIGFPGSFPLAFHLTHALHHWRASTPEERAEVIADLDDEAVSTVADLAEEVLAQHNARLDAEYAELRQTLGLPAEETAPIFDDADYFTGFDLRRQSDPTPRPEALSELLDAMEQGARQAVEVLRAHGLELVYEGERVVLLGSLYLLERVGGVWTGCVLDGDGEAETGEDLEAALAAALAWGVAR